MNNHCCDLCDDMLGSTGEGVCNNVACTCHQKAVLPDDWETRFDADFWLHRIPRNTKQMSYIKDFIREQITRERARWEAEFWGTIDDIKPTGVLKTCPICGETKDETLFHRSYGYVHGCAECGRKKSRAYHQKTGYHKMPGRSAWRSMRARCLSPKHKSYPGYGGRGIFPDPKWARFDGFWEDMGSTWKEGLSLDRIDNDGPYTKENCRWATTKEQGNNKRNTKRYEIDGVSRPLTEWCEIHGVDAAKLRSILRYGKNLSFEEALNRLIAKGTE